MSRSNRKPKRPGKEYWSKRPVSNAHGATPGKTTKKITNGKERMAAKKELLAEPEHREDG